MAPATAIPTTSKLQVLYLPIVRHPNGDYIPESRLQDLSRDCVINDIAAGTWDNGVIRVIASSLSTDEIWDASADIAAAALYQAAERCGYSIPRSCREFCETFLGLNAVQSVLVAAA